VKGTGRGLIPAFFSTDIKTATNFNEDNPPPGQCLNPGPSKYESEMLIT